jgi:hypothetical protein
MYKLSVGDMVTGEGELPFDKKIYIGDYVMEFSYEKEGG